jgi:hypothetical protein
MAKPKRKAKKEAVQHQCECVYNKKIARLFDESLRKSVDDDAQAQEYYTALSHSDTFDGMFEVLMEDNSDPTLVLSDAVRFGFEAGKRMAEIDNLEKMVGY